MESHLTGIISGYFAPLSRNHLDLINDARNYCTRLCCIVNNDKQLLLKKGFVFQPEGERLEIMSNLKGIDHVFLSTDQDRTVCKSLFRIRNVWPNEVMVFLNGGDVTETAETETCKQLGIGMRFGVGGNEKIWSSSKTLDKFTDYVLNNYERIR